MVSPATVAVPASRQCRTLAGRERRWALASTTCRSHQVAGLRATGDKTLVIKLLQPASDLTNILAMPFASAAPVEYLSYVPDSKPLWAAVVAGAAGAVVGDSLGYVVGRTVGERLLGRIPRRLVEPRQVDRATALLRRLGGRAVFVGRFTAALRALVPGLAGIAGMPYRTFVAWNLAGGVLWATGFVLLGFAVGKTYARVERVAGTAGLVLLGAIVIIAVATLLGRRRSARRHPNGTSNTDRSRPPWLPGLVPIVKAEVAHGLPGVMHGMV